MFYWKLRVPRVRLPDGSVRLVEPDWVGQLNGFTLLFEALVLMLTQQMPLAAVSRADNLSWHRVHAICSRYVDLAPAAANLSSVTAVAIDETSYRRSREYLTLVADMQARRAVFVSTGKGFKHDRAVCNVSERARRLARASALGEHRHVAGFHQGRQ